MDQPAPQSESAFNPLSNGFIDDPYPAYARLRTENPCFYYKFLRCWVVSRYEDVTTLLKDSRVRTVPMGGIRFTLGARRLENDAVRRQRANSLLHLNPPAHTRVRGLVRKAFTPRRIGRLIPDITQQAITLLEPLRRDGVLDLMDDYAYLLPIHVICRLLGVPDSDIPMFSEWTKPLTKSMDPFMSKADVLAANDAATKFHDYFAELLKIRRQDPGDDLVSALLRVEAEGNRLNEEELIGAVELLLMAGHETTMNLIGNGMKLLFEHQDQIDAFMGDMPTAIRGVDEILRFDSPVQLTLRRTIEEVSVGDTTLPAGSYLLILLSSANRDESIFPEAERFDTSRDPNPHVAFGTGIHFCIGATLARIEGAIALQEIFNVGNIRATEEPERNRSITIRGFSRFPIQIDA